MFLQKRVYPCNSFWKTFGSRWKELKRVSNVDAPGDINLHLLHPPYKSLIIPCGEIDGVVLGSWTSIDEQSIPTGVDDDSSEAAYWIAAAAWSDAWDQRIIDRVSHMLKFPKL